MPFADARAVCGFSSTVKARSERAVMLHVNMRRLAVRSNANILWSGFLTCCTKREAYQQQRYKDTLHTTEACHFRKRCWTDTRGNTSWQFNLCSQFMRFIRAKSVEVLLSHRFCNNYISPIVLTPTSHSFPIPAQWNPPPVRFLCSFRILLLLIIIHGRREGRSSSAQMK